VLIVLDEVTTSKPQPLELRFHLEQTATRLPGDVFVAKGPTTTLRIAPLTQYGMVATYDETRALDARQGADGMLRTLHLGHAGPSWRNAVAFSWGAAPATVSLTRNADLWRFETGDRVADFDWTTSEACSYEKGKPSTCGAAPAARDLPKAK
jgi:hypothetical protein